MRHYPENTYSAIQAALASGADYIEFDVQMNADGDFIVIHDANFKRTAGVDQSVFKTTNQQCQQISVHNPKVCGDKFYPEAVPSLSLILELIKMYPQASAIVEIKKQSLHHWGYEKVMHKLINQLMPYQKQCVLISFDDHAIEYAKQKSSLMTGWVFNKFDKAHYQRAKELKADFLMSNYKKLPKDKLPWPEFKRWMLYDIMDADLAVHYAENGVELIETGDLDTILQSPKVQNHTLFTPPCLLPISSSVKQQQPAQTITQYAR
jgi:glycerophosphoryl diester phosphodiesterase